jgi:hypothetical protein
LDTTKFTVELQAMRRTKKKPIHQCQCDACKRASRSAEAKEHQAINQVMSLLHEKGRRQFAGLLALQWGRGGLEQLHVITGLSQPTIRRGRAEVQRKERQVERNRVRKPGAGRQPVEKNNPRF